MALEFLLDYVPPPTVAAFLRDKTEVKVILGPVGSGKSSGCILHALKNAMELLRTATASVEAGMWWSATPCRS